MKKTAAQLSLEKEKENSIKICEAIIKHRSLYSEDSFPSEIAPVIGMRVNNCLMKLRDMKKEGLVDSRKRSNGVVYSVIEENYAKYLIMPIRKAKTREK